MKDFSVKIDPVSYDAGFQAGKDGQPDRVPAGMDSFSWSSGFIEGKAARTGHKS